MFRYIASEQGDTDTSAATTAGKVQRIYLSSASWVDKLRIPQGLAPPSIVSDLWKLHPPQLGKVKIFGKEVATPRFHQGYGLPYRFSGVEVFGGPVPELLKPFMAWANSLPEYGQRFNAVLVNWYESGEHYIGPHADDESQLAPGEPIVSISLGATRTLRIRDRGGSRAIRHNIDMPHGTCLVMGGAMQREFTHEVPKIGGAKGKAVGRRINITFRAFNAGDATPPSKRRRVAPSQQLVT